MKVKIEITCPNEEIGFVEGKRSFCIEGNIYSESIIPNNAKLRINIYDSKKHLVRYVECDRKYKDIYTDYSDLKTYDESLDPLKNKLKEYGFAPLIVDDIKDPEETIRLATNKCFYNDNRFSAIIVNASNTDYGALFDDGMNYCDENRKPYSLLDFGKYTIEVLLTRDSELLAKTNKEFIIGYREKMLIGRFNPISHKNRLIKFCEENNISIIKDLLPGYLNPYLGTWYYHMGIIQMYNANDICLFENTDVYLFNYLLDRTSTSYSTELCYLQTQNKVNNIKTFFYDIGEAIIDDKKACVKLFNSNENGKLYRIDVLKNNNDENKYYLDRRNVKRSIYDLSDVIINANETVAITGVIKPIQLDPNDFILNKDNSYIDLDYPYTIRYYINKEIIDRKLNMERIDEYSIGKSMYEFYNIFNICCDCHIEIECIYKKGKTIKIQDLYIKVK